MGIKIFRSTRLRLGRHFMGNTGKLKVIIIITVAKAAVTSISNILGFMQHKIEVYVARDWHIMLIFYLLCYAAVFI